MSTEIIPVKPSELQASLEYCARARRPAFVLGPPGIGKSKIMEFLARAILQVDFLDTRLVTFDPVDLRGLPWLDIVSTRTGKGTNFKQVDTKVTKWSVPDFLPKSGKGILFFDELPEAATSVQAAALQISLDFKLGEYTLPEGWVPMAAGNSLPKLAALRERFIQFELVPDVNDWCKWAINSDIEPVVVAFMRSFPDLLNDFQPRAHKSPNPRSWEFVSQIVKQKPPASVQFALIQGCVGKAAATEFVGYLQLFQQVPDPDAIIMNPTTAMIPEKPGIKFAVCMALAYKASVQNYGQIMKYMARMPKEYATLFVKDSVARVPGLVTTQAYVKWQIEAGVTV